MIDQQASQFAHRPSAYQHFVCLALLLLLVPFVCLAAPRSDFRRLRQRDWLLPAKGVAFGAPNTVFGWGERLERIELPRVSLDWTRVPAPLGEGGCTADVNRDGVPDLITLERSSGPNNLGEMVWLDGPDYNPHVVDTEAEFSDCLATTLFGRRGVLVIHRHSQLRFYEIPQSPLQRWPYREIYSIYTPSAQGGLARADVDKDGHEDILVGNYWLRSPATEQASWRLFPINNWWDGPRAALLRVGFLSPLAVAAEREKSPARLALFSPPNEPAALWVPTMLQAVPPLRRPTALAAADLNNDGKPEIIVGENAGKGSRLIVYWALPNGGFQGSRIDITPGLLGVWAVDVDGDNDLDLVGAGPEGVIVWENQRRK